ncbi:MAG: HD domain-containing protein [Oscillospiraceae bacterium]|nr:HD domain-containing protein [Oscillospiraceae bacterium]
MKNIKDPIYGYIQIDTEYVKLIDTAAFQRLRNIRQTSYQALYPSALHNRFVHSLGVFHLGKKAIDYFYENINNLPDTPEQSILNQIRNTFIIACLLHDVGHSPFSHTGENYYYALGSDLKQMLCDAVDSDSFLQAINPGMPKIENPHEAMSVLIGLDMCDNLGLYIDRELFARSILGLEYIDNPQHLETIIRNAIISILNGKLIDVDKLDYLTRDSYVIGFSSIAIDVDRLLSGYTICYDNLNVLQIAYKRGSHSVIENVIYASDLERRWIQKHPVVLYDSMLTDFAIRYYNKSMKDKYIPNNAAIQSVFIKAALTEAGLSNDNIPLRLLSDDDIVHFIKNTEERTPIAQQFFARNARLKPMWKTEAVFDDYCKRIFGKEILEKLVDDFKSVLNFLENHTGFFINHNALNAANNAISEAEQQMDEQIKASAKLFKRVRYICEIFMKFYEDKSLPDFEFALVVASKFESNYRKIMYNQINIELENKRVVKLDELMSVTAREASFDKQTSLFYVYTTKNNYKQYENREPSLGEEFINFIRMKYDPNAF